MALHHRTPEPEPLARTYVITRGRSGAGPKRRFDLVTLIIAAGSSDRTVSGLTPGPLMPEHRRILSLCRRPLSVAELAAHLRLPFSATAVLVGDLVDAGLAVERRPARAAAVDPAVLREVINGLQRL
ncbi:MAG: DUF742 domain-containing protein [Catenulispora sp.]|nr:DUF742 domain-containing protein [Catenulispora sp.]